MLCYETLVRYGRGEYGGFRNEPVPIPEANRSFCANLSHVPHAQYAPIAGYNDRAIITPPGLPRGGL